MNLKHFQCQHLIKQKLLTGISRNFHTHTVESSVFASLDELPEEVKALVNAEEQKNIYIQHNNTPAFVSLSEDLKAKGVILTDIYTAIREHSELVQKYFMTDGVKVHEHKLTALHAALLNGGVFVYVPKNVVVEEPIQVIYLHDDQTCFFIQPHFISSE